MRVKYPIVPGGSFDERIMATVAKTPTATLDKFFIELAWLYTSDCYWGSTHNFAQEFETLEEGKCRLHSFPLSKSSLFALLAKTRGGQQYTFYVRFTGRRFRLTTTPGTIETTSYIASGSLKKLMTKVCNRFRLRVQRCPLLLERPAVDLVHPMSGGYQGGNVWERTFSDAEINSTALDDLYTSLGEVYCLSYYYGDCSYAEALDLHVDPGKFLMVSNSAETQQLQFYVIYCERVSGKKESVALTLHHNKWTFPITVMGMTMSAAQVSIAHLVERLSTDYQVVPQYSPTVTRRPDVTELFPISPERAVPMRHYVPYDPTTAAAAATTTAETLPPVDVPQRLPTMK